MELTPQETESLTNYILIEHDLAHIKPISQVSYINFYYPDFRTHDSQVRLCKTLYASN